MRHLDAARAGNPRPLVLRTCPRSMSHPQMSSVELVRTHAPPTSIADNASLARTEFRPPPSRSKRPRRALNRLTNLPLLSSTKHRRPRLAVPTASRRTDQPMGAKALWSASGSIGIAGRNTATVPPVAVAMSDSSLRALRVREDG